VGVKNAFLTIVGMLGNNDKLDAVAQTDSLELNLSLNAPVCPLVYGDAVNFVEIIPALTMFSRFPC